MQHIDEDEPRLESISVAAGDGFVNGTSMPMDNIIRINLRVRGNGAGDSSFRFVVNVSMRRRTRALR